MVAIRSLCCGVKRNLLTDNLVAEVYKTFKNKRT